MKSGGQWRPREAVLFLGLLLGVFHSISSVRFEVKDLQKNTCILADLWANFTVVYNSGSKLVKADFPLPDNATVNTNSTCGETNGTKSSPLLVIGFGNGNLLSINFTKSEKQYAADVLVFAYNISDKILFPGAVENGTKEVTSNKSEIYAEQNSVYSCFHAHVITMGNVTITFHHVKLEAFMSSSNYSKNATACKEDFSPTSPPIPPTSAPSPNLVGHYRVNDTSGAACLLATMALELDFNYTNQAEKIASYNYSVVEQHFVVSGNCTNSSATLILSSDDLYLLFKFTVNTTANKFFLSHVLVNTSVIPGAKEPRFIRENSNLSYFQTTTHKSYKCNAKQTYQIASNFSIVPYDLQIQVFNIEGDKFGPAVECTADQNGMLVPIVVGAALAGLVLIVLIAYLIGRKRSHAGYQTI